MSIPVSPETRPMNVIQSFWNRITEPRRLKVIYAIFYVVSTLTGLVTLVNPPQSIEGVLGDTLMSVWSVLFMAGGVGGMLTVLNGRWKWERWSIGSILMGIGIYSLVILTLHFAQAGSRLTQLGVLLIASGLFIARLELIRWYSFDPRR